MPRLRMIRSFSVRPATSSRSIEVQVTLTVPAGPPQLLPAYLPDPDDDELGGIVGRAPHGVLSHTA